MGRGCAPSRAPRSGSNQRVSPRAPEMLVTQRSMGYNGFSWDFMGEAWESLDFCGFFSPAARHVRVLFCASNPVDKSVICRIGRESLWLEPGKLGEQSLEIMLSGAVEMLDVQ